MNVLLITLDQFRGDTLGCAGHLLVRTPHLDRLAQQGVRLARHYSQGAPCSPGRASLYTGMYQQNHRVVANGTPLDRRFDNIAWLARRAGYTPTLFGYTDQSVDPRDAHGPNDPRLSDYEEVLPGFDVALKLVSTRPHSWTQWLTAQGHVVPDDPDEALRGESARPAEHSMAAFLTNHFLAWHQQQVQAKHPWFAHLSHFRPHPPYAAAGHFAQLYNPQDVPLPIALGSPLHKLHAGLLRSPAMQAPTDERAMRELRAQYYGMVSEVDHQLGRVWRALEASGQWENTLVIVTADHADELGDHGLLQKAGYFEGSYHILGIIRDPRVPAAHGTTVNAFTENVDILPTVCDALGEPVPLQCDGLPLTHFLRGEAPPSWRDAAHWEYDWRSANIPRGPHPWPWDRRLERQNLAVRRTQDAAYVHFADGSSLCYDLARDPTWHTLVEDPSVILPHAQALLSWRAQHMERTLTGMLVEDGGIGRWPTLPDGWHAR